MSESVSQPYWILEHSFTTGSVATIICTYEHVTNDGTLFMVVQEGHPPVLTYVARVGIDTDFMNNAMKQMMQNIQK